MISLLQAPEYRDYPFNFTAGAYESAVRLQNGCYQPRWEQAPQDSVQPMAARGMTSLVIYVQPGSWVLKVEGSICQITDLGSGLTFWDEPDVAPGWLPIPRLVSDPGALKVELWNDSSSPADVGILILLAEPIPEVIRR